MKTFRRTFLFAVLALLASGPAFGATHTNTITGTSFVPRNMTIKAGDTIVWVNVAFHSVTGPTGGEPFCGSTIFDASVVSCSATFNIPGTYNYYCRPHNLEFNMNGSVTVQPVFKITATNTWTGAAPSGYWSAPANWSPAGVPTNGNDLVFPGGLPPGDMVSTNDLTNRIFRSISLAGGHTIRGNRITLTNDTSVIINSGTNEIACDWIFSAIPSPSAPYYAWPRIWFMGYPSELTVSGNVGGGYLNVGGGRLVMRGQFPEGRMYAYGGIQAFYGDFPHALSVTNVGGIILVQGSQPNLSLTTLWEMESAACASLIASGVVGDIAGCGHITLDTTLSVKNLGHYGGWGGLDIRLNGTNVGEYGRLVASGDVSLSSGRLLPSAGFNPQAGQVFTIVEKTSPGPIANAIFGPEGSFTTLNGMPFRISYVGGDGNDVTLTATPPRLNVVRTNPAQVRLSWPTNYPGFQLQRAPAIDGSAPWSNHPTSPVLMGTNYTVTQPAATNQEFFRLKQP